MSTIDDYLQHLRDAIGIKSMKQLDEEEKPSAYLSNAAQGIVETPNYDPLKHGLAGPKPLEPLVGPPRHLKGPWEGADDKDTLMYMLAGSDGTSARSYPFGMTGTEHSGPLTDSEALEYVDFLRGHGGPDYEVTVGEPRIHGYSVDVGEPQIDPSMNAMRRRRGR